MSTDTTSATGTTLGAEQLGKFLYQMVLIRRFEEKCGELYTKGKIRGFLHLYTGQEACAVGSIATLEERDKIVTHYRDHGHALARGVDPNRIMAELYGKATGLSAGRGGSMHLYDAPKGFLGGYAIVAAHLPLAVGLGMASNMKRENFVTLCIFGDGSVGEGEFHEALNLSVLWNTPTIFFCENNLYGMGVPFHASLSTDIPKLAAAYNMPAVSVDGMDVIAVYEATRKAVEHARSGKGPYFIEALTYRYRGHSMADPELYRVKAEIEHFRQRDAIELLKTRMFESGMLDEAGFADIERRAEQVVDESVEFSEQSPQPDISTLFDYLYKEPSDG